MPGLDLRACDNLLHANDLHLQYTAKLLRTTRKNHDRQTWKTNA